MGFNIDISSLYSGMLFGAYESTCVIPPACFHCKPNDKPYDRLFYVTNGTIEFDNTLTINKGEFAYLPNNISYDSRWIGDSIGKYITLNFINDNNLTIFPNVICKVVTDKTGMYYKMFLNALNIWNEGSIGYKFDFMSELYKILHYVYVDTTKNSLKEKYNVIYNGIMYLENNFLEDIDIDTLAKYCNISSSSFRRLFKQYKSIPPITYKNYLRIEKAKELLLSKEYNVSEAAEAVNLPDICYFNKLFKKFVGQSPKQYVESMTFTITKNT